MRGTKCGRAWRRSAVLAAVVGAVVACGWIFGFDSGPWYPIAIGVGTALAVFGDTRRNCSPGVLRRRG